jgi:hypothetical protein
VVGALLTENPEHHPQKRNRVQPADDFENTILYFTSSKKFIVSRFEEMVLQNDVWAMLKKKTIKQQYLCAWQKSTSSTLYIKADKLKRKRVHRAVAAMSYRAATRTQYIRLLAEKKFVILGPPSRLCK